MTIAARNTAPLTNEFLNYLRESLGGTQEGRAAMSQEISVLFAKCFRAYQECDEEVQRIIRDMVDILTNPETDEDEHIMAMHTLTEALFPDYDHNKLGICVKEADKASCENNQDGNAALAELDEEERSFAERLKTLMDQKGLTQGQLAERAGVGQPAISMMLKRECRPQRRTVHKLAEALGAPPEALWPISRGG